MIRVQFTYTCDQPGCKTKPLVFTEKVKAGDSMQMTVPDLWSVVQVSRAGGAMPAIYCPQHRVVRLK